MKEYLPIGSVVSLLGVNRKAMIAGIMQYQNQDTSKIFDYMAVPYPEGYMGEGSVLLFNHEMILDVIFKGYDNPERKAFMEFIAQAQEQQDSKAK